MNASQAQYPITTIKYVHSIRKREYIQVPSLAVDHFKSLPHHVRALLLRVVAVPNLNGLSPFRSETHFKFVGLAVLLALYVHLPSPPFFDIVRRVLPLRRSVMPLLSPFLTLELHVTPIVPDWRDSQLYVSMVTVSAIVGLTFTVIFALLKFVALDFRLTVS